MAAAGETAQVVKAVVDAARTTLPIKLLAQRKSGCVMNSDRIFPIWISNNYQSHANDSKENSAICLGEVWWQYCKRIAK